MTPKILADEVAIRILDSDGVLTVPGIGDCWRTKTGLLMVGNEGRMSARQWLTARQWIRGNSEPVPADGEAA